MRILFRLFLWLVGLTVVVAVAAAIWVRFFFAADHYRPQLEVQLEQRLGREVQLGEGLELSILPWLGLETGRVTLANVEGAPAPMLQAQRAKVAVRLLPLLTGAIEADTVELEGLVLHLQRDAAGKGNWEFPVATTAEQTAREKSAKSGIGLAMLGGIRMQNAEIHWRDAQAGQFLVLRKADLVAGAYQPDRDWPITLSADYSLGEGKTQQRGHFRLSAALALDLAQQKIALNRLRATLNDSTLHGQLSATLGRGIARPRAASVPALRFDLKLDRLDLDRYLRAADPAGKPLPKTDPVSAATVAATQLPVDLVRALDVDGRLQVGWLRGFGLEVENAELAVVAKDGVLTLEPLRGDFYRGSYDGVVSLDAREEPAIIKMHERVQGVDAGALIAALSGQGGLRGRMDAELEVQAQGADTQAVLKTLQGDAHAELKDAVLEGVNLGQLVRQAAAAIEGQPLPSAATANETRLLDLQIHSYLHGGIAQIERLHARTELLALEGGGQLNLLEQTLALKLDAEVVLTEEQGLPRELRRLQGKRFPMRLSGTWNAPRVEVDLETALKAVVQEKLQERLEHEIQERFGGAGLFDLLGGQSGGWFGAPNQYVPRPVRPVAPNLPNAPAPPSNAEVNAPSSALPSAAPNAQAAPPVAPLDALKSDAQKLEEQLQRGLEDALRGLFR